MYIFHLVMKPATENFPLIFHRGNFDVLLSKIDRHFKAGTKAYGYYYITVSRIYEIIELKSKLYRHKKDIQS